MFIIKVKEKSKLKKVGEWMGIYLNPGSAMFQKSLKSKIYVDKSGLLAILNELVDTEQRYVCVSRPRRFGKTLNMSMLQHFFEIGTDKALFDGLYISGKSKLCEEYMGQFPVIFLSLKEVDGLTFASARYRLTELVGIEAERFSFLADSDKLSENEKEKYRTLIRLCDGKYSMGEELLKSSLKILSQLLYKYYEKKTIIIIDEYDVPLDKAFENNYYNEMIILLRNMLEQSLKTNDNLYMAVLTGCLRIARESIFTGLNNFNIFSITDQYFDEYFGFTDKEVKEILQYYKVPEAFEQTKKWYDGYRFGNTDIYCPWDVINHCRALKVEPDATPQPYWINTSGNYIVKRFIEKANQQTRREIEQLIEGKAIQKEIRLELTYNELDSTIENLWSVLFATGYLTQQGKPLKRFLQSI